MQTFTLFCRYPKSFIAAILLLSLVMTMFDSVRATNLTDDQLLDDAVLRYAICCARVDAELDEAETKVVVVHLVFDSWDKELIERAQLKAIFYPEATPEKRSGPVKLRQLAGDNWGFAFKPESGLIMEVASPLLRSPVRFRLMEPYRSREPAINDLRFVPY